MWGQGKSYIRGLYKRICIKLVSNYNKSIFKVSTQKSATEMSPTNATTVIEMIEAPDDDLSNETDERSTLREAASVVAVMAR